MIKFKPEVDANDFRFLNQKILFIFIEFVKWAEDRGLPVLVTSMKTDKVSGRVSTTHEEGRAIDISIKGWDVDSIDNIVFDLNKKLANVGAISKKDGISRAIVVHNAGSGMHFHLQSRY